MGTPAWLQELWAIHEANFGHDWAAHVLRLNRELRITEPTHQLATAVAGLPPPWFNGDVEAIEPGQWTLVLSLNPQLSKFDYGTAAEHTPRTWWDLWRTKNTAYWRAGFFRPIARLAARSLGHPELTPATERAYATSEMVYIELCPYASNKFGLSQDQLGKLAGDKGFEVAARVRTLLITQAQPALILVNGSRAVEDLATAMAVAWNPVQYRSQSDPSKRLCHCQGTYEVDGARVPAVGFPFLSKPATHNGDVECRQLATHAAAFLKHDGETGSDDAPTPRR